MRRCTWPTTCSAPRKPRACGTACAKPKGCLQRAQLAVGVGVRAERLVEHLRHLCAAEPRAPEKAVGEELARVLKDGFSDKEISDGITALLNYRNLARAQDDVVAGVWLDYLERGRTFAWSADMDKKISALTPDVVNAAMRISAPGRLQHRRRRRLQESGALTHNRGGLARPRAAHPAPASAGLLARRHDAPPCLPARSCACRYPAGAPPPAGSPTAGQAAPKAFSLPPVGQFIRKKFITRLFGKMFSTNTGLSQVG